MINGYKRIKTNLWHLIFKNYPIISEGAIYIHHDDRHTTILSIGHFSPLELGYVFPRFFRCHPL